MAEVRKRKSRRRVPWGQMLGKPIERITALSEVEKLFEREERREDYRRYIEQEVLAEQFKKMCCLKQHYGIEGETGWRPWYQLALAVASELDDGLKIIDPPPTPTGKTAPRWRGAEGLQILSEIEVLREEALKETGGGSVTDYALLAELKELAPHRYGGMSLDELEKNYYEAKRHHDKPQGSGATKRRRKKRSA